MRNTMRRPITLVSLAAVATAGFSTAALAHIGDHSHMSFSEGLLHPFSGLDHVLAMVAVGLWASQLGGRALWLLPVTFPVVMAVGAALGFGGASLAWIEIGIAL
jgi:urease accessory protein